MMLPDTNVIIYALAGLEPYRSVLKKWTANNEMLLSVIVVAEYLSGAKREEIKIFDTLINHIVIASVDLRVARKAADIRREKMACKIKMHLPDCLIAAQCQIYGATLATNNPGDYPSETPKFSF